MRKLFAVFTAVIMLIGIVSVTAGSVYAISPDEVKAQLGQFISDKYKPGSAPPTGEYRSGTSGCFGFVDLLCRKIFGHNVASQKSAKELNISSGNFKQIGSTLSNSAGNLTESTLSDLFSKALPGDVVQMDYTAYSGTNKDQRHTMMVYSVADSGVVFYHAGSSKIYFGASAGTQPLWGTTGNVLTWSNFLARFPDSNDGLSLYRAKSVSGTLTPEPPVQISKNPDDYTMPTTTYYYKSPPFNNDYVKWIQAVLYQLGYGDTVDGSFGTETDAALRAFQQDSGLDVDGRCGPATRSALAAAWEEAKNSGGQSGETPHIPGDINGDGVVNNKDISRLSQYLSEWDVEVNEAALDTNGDGNVNNKDLSRLFQYLSEWDVEIF